ncbi:hypothetical protein XELAEV_18026215mg [Xenopus laevis]|uniref:Uncharacterized protein n=1 Tax=Xenopus laevis TaxID=8355 RepID=A0A974CVA4_XENLA|nr:hypothetical protein XELAEV_18026215mg [Xenopus laevis]
MNFQLKVVETQSRLLSRGATDSLGCCHFNATEAGRLCVITNYTAVLAAAAEPLGRVMGQPLFFGKISEAGASVVAELQM